MFNTLSDTTPQKLPRHLAARTHVIARGWPWQLQRARAGTGCVAVEVTPGARGAPSLATLLYPFDSLTPVSGRERWRRGSRDQLAAHLRTIPHLCAGQPLASLSSMPVAPW